MRGKPWYERVDDYIRVANELIKYSPYLREDESIKEEFRVFNEINVARLIFESNLIERAGMPYGETRRILEQDFSKVPSEPEEFYGLMLEGQDFGSAFLSEKNLERMIACIRQAGKGAEIFPSISMAGKSRSWREVYQHYKAYEFVECRKWSFWMSYQAFGMRKLLETDFIPADKKKSAKRLVTKVLKELDKQSLLLGWESGPMLFDETFIKGIHLRIAQGLLPEDAKVPAGEYRIDNRIVGWDTAFPAPALLPKTMEVFVERANKYVMDCSGDRANVLETAARISYDLVSIHPFPDFNGRVSRLIANLVLGVFGCPFPVAIKGDKKGRDRYFYSLKRANKGNIEILSGLIAKAVIDVFFEIDKHLMQSDIKTIAERLPELRELDKSSSLKIDFWPGAPFSI